METREQCRAARGLLGWTQQALANASGLSKTAINNYERGSGDIKSETFHAIFLAFDKAGLDFIDDSGVKKRINQSRIIKGQDSYFQLLDDVIETIGDKNEELLVCNYSQAYEEKLLLDWPEKMHDYHERLNQHNISRRLLIKENDYLFAQEPERYRWMNKEWFHFGRISFTYGNKTAFKLWYNTLIVCVESEEASSSERERFETIWQQSSIPTTPPDKGSLPHEGLRT